MGRGVSLALVMILAGAVSTATAAEEYILYKPEKAKSQNIPAPGEGVLTKTVTIQKGDTLKKLSQRYSGRSWCFPQILLFNNIKNPDLIQAGAQLRVPLTKVEAATGATKTGTEEKKRKHAKSVVRHKRHAPSTMAFYGRGEGRLFRSGVSAFERRQYSRAVDIFGRYLEIYPNSPNAAEAALLRAECYERLSGD